MVANALSRKSFIHGRISQRLLSETYVMLLREAEQFDRETAQYSFRISANLQNIQSSLGVATDQCPLTSAELSAVLEGHRAWETGMEGRAISCISQDIQQLLPPGQCTLPVFSLEDLWEKQEEDPCLSRVLSYISRGKRRESVREAHNVLKVLKHWEKLNVLDEVLHSISRGTLVGKKRPQFLILSFLVRLLVCYWLWPAIFLRLLMCICAAISVRSREHDSYGIGISLCMVSQREFTQTKVQISRFS